MIEVRRKGEKIGMQKGIEKGMQKGIEKGIQKGMQKGMQDRNLEIIKNMLKKGYDVKSIQEITELSKEDVEKIKKELQKASGE